MCLDLLKPGQEALVTDMHTGRYLTERLAAFGFVPGTRVYCRYRSPGGQMRAMECRGAVIALRARDLKRIEGEWL